MKNAEKKRQQNKPGVRKPIILSKDNNDAQNVGLVPYCGTTRESSSIEVSSNGYYKPDSNLSELSSGLITMCNSHIPESFPNIDSLEDAAENLKLNISDYCTSWMNWADYSQFCLCDSSAPPKHV
ncbi:unnamed protein product [Moneuplotes crassus]|uniref:Uncharacterized protein n=1 Tax=Euplotes crassus TaxID=5936 RepID=A0AAD1XL79_EUPCR|nr:unnamed protein product [Moneuplotes crassus]